MSVTKSPNDPNANWKDIADEVWCLGLKHESSQELGETESKTREGRDIPLAVVAMLCVNQGTQRDEPVQKRVRNLLRFLL